MPRTILILSSLPRDRAPLRVASEVRAIQAAIRRGRFRDEYRVVVCLGVRASDVHGLLMEHRPAMVHFTGHGWGEHGVVLEDDDGDSLPVSGADLAEMLGHFRDDIECVLLNSCQSESLIKDVAALIPFVIGMKPGLDDRAAGSFAAAFYEGLANGEDIPWAYGLACSAARLDGGSLDRVATLAEPQQPRASRNHVHRVKTRLAYYAAGTFTISLLVRLLVLEAATTPRAVVMALFVTVVTLVAVAFLAASALVPGSRGRGRRAVVSVTSAAFTMALLLVFGMLVDDAVEFEGNVIEDLMLAKDWRPPRDPNGPPESEAFQNTCINRITLARPPRIAVEIGKGGEFVIHLKIQFVWEMRNNRFLLGCEHDRSFFDRTYAGTIYITLRARCPTSAGEPIEIDFASAKMRDYTARAKSGFWSFLFALIETETMAMGEEYRRPFLDDVAKHLVVKRSVACSPSQTP
jgi:hypothetical protein